MSPVESRWVTPYAAATRARSSASLISSRRRDSGTATRVAGGIRSRAAKTLRTSASAGSPPTPSSPTGISTSRCAPRVRAACAIWASCGRCSGRSAMTPSTRPGGSSARTSSGLRRSRWNGPCPPSPSRRTGPPTPATPVADRPDVGHVQRGHRGALAVGEHQRPAQRVVRVQAGGERGRHLQGHRHRPGRAVGEPAAPAQRGQVGAGHEAGQRGVRAGQQQLQIGQLTGARRVRRRVPQHLVGQHPPVAHPHPQLADRHTVSQPTADRSRAPLHEPRPGGGTRRVSRRASGAERPRPLPDRT